MIIPPPITYGDKIAIISPSSVVKEEYIDGAARLLEKKGFVPIVMPAAKGPAAGSYAAEAGARLEDFHQAWMNPEIKGILCSRGGYGAVHLLPDINKDLITNNPKWLIGYSDISALHAFLFRTGICSLHGPMAKHLTEEGEEDKAVKSLFDIIEGKDETIYETSPHDYNVEGVGEGVLAGGNLAVLNALFGTDYDVLSSPEGKKQGIILFVEDISEAIYAVERMFYHIYLSGGFQYVKGLVVGRFTEYRSDRNYHTMEDMIASFLRRCGLEGKFPVAFNFPVGHITENLALPLGFRAELRVAPAQVSLRLQGVYC